MNFFLLSIILDARRVELQQSNFDRFSKGWWDKKGDMKVLHSMHQTRMLFIKERINNRFKNLNSYSSILQKKNILDLGCGGGLLSESLAKDYPNSKFVIDVKSTGLYLNSKILKNNNVSYQQIDLVDEKKLSSKIKDFIKKYKRIDYLVNTTGVLWFGKDISAVDLDLKIWDRVFDINLKTMVLLSKIIIPVMKKNKFGSMVHISSVDALSGDDKPQDAYGASKAAMIRLSKSLAIQFGQFNIRSNCILPGAVETRMQDRWKKIPNAKKNLKKLMPIKKIIQPKGIAEGILFLLSDQSEYITGIELIIDGGLTARP